jgi:hypothetical protein
MQNKTHHKADSTAPKENCLDSPLTNHNGLMSLAGFIDKSRQQRTPSHLGAPHGQLARPKSKTLHDVQRKTISFFKFIN